MKTIRVRIVEELRIGVVHGEKTAYGKQINHGNRPEASSFAQGGNVIVHINVDVVREGLFRLNVRAAEVRITAVNRSQQNNLLKREILLQIFQPDVDAVSYTHLTLPTITCV